MFDEITVQQTREAFFENLLEFAYLEAAVDGDQLALAYCWLRANRHDEH